MYWKTIKKPKFILFVIALITFYTILINLPRTPVKFGFEIPFMDGKRLDVDTEIGGYNFSLFGGAIQRDLEIKKGLDIEGGVSVLLQADMSKIVEPDRNDALDSLKNIIERRVNLLGLSEATVQTSKQGDTYRVIVELAGVDDPGEALEVIGQTALLDFREIKPLEVKAEGSEEPDPIEVALEDQFVSTGLTGADLRKALVVTDQSGTLTSGTPQIQLTFNAEGTKKFREITQKNLNQPVAIYLDDRVLMSPVVQSVITDGVAVVTGQFTPEEAKFITTQLNAGALPVPVSILEQRTVGPSLGQESVNKSIIGGLLGLILVVAFMIIYYGRLGFFASIALVIYSLITLALYRLIPVVLTLPGVAGFILSIGMAVDANILIFERIKEELRMKKPLSIALENGFGRSWDSIRDANVATLLTAFILFNPFDWGFLPTSGLVRGFALTLSLGIIISLFTGVFITRNLVRVFYHPKIQND